MVRGVKENLIKQSEQSESSVALEENKAEKTVEYVLTPADYNSRFW